MLNRIEFPRIKIGLKKKDKKMQSVKTYTVKVSVTF